MATNEPVYSLPNPTTPAELARLDLQHNAFLLSLGGLHLAELPTPPPRFVVDLGCGTGTWAAEYAAAHPEATVIGADVAPPTHQLSLANLAYVKADATTDWTPIIEAARKLQGSDGLADIKFDYVNIRLLTYAMRTTSWPPFFKLIGTHVAPGGILEVADTCLPRDSKADHDVSGSALYRGMQLTMEASARLGVELEADKKHPQSLKDAGFEIVEKKMMLWPSGVWGETENQRAIGKVMHDNGEMLLKAFPERFRKLGVPGEEKEKGGWEGMSQRALVELREKAEELKLFSTTVVFVAKKV